MTPIPSCESARLEALDRYEILGTESDSAFDDLARLASYLCRTPIAAISFVDAERQWFKSSVGLDHKEAPREGAFCAHTIVGTDGFMVENTDADERFKNHPWVVEQPALRFYAGVPLMTPDGYAIGSLAVMDLAPRTLAPEQLACLRTIANQVMAQLELRRAPRSDIRQEQTCRKETENPVQAILDRTAHHAGPAYFSALVQELATITGADHVFCARVLPGGSRAQTVALWSGGSAQPNFEYDLAGTPCEQVSGGTLCHYPTGVQALFPDDILLQQMGIESYMGFPFLGSQGTPVGWISIMGVEANQMPARAEALLRFCGGKAGSELERMEAEAARWNSQQLLENIVENIPLAVFIKNLQDEFRVQLWNKAAESIFEIPRTDILGHNAHDFWPRQQADSYLADDRRCMAEGAVQNIAEEPSISHTRGDSVLHTSKVPLFDQVGMSTHRLALCEDITARRKQEEEVWKSRRQLQAIVEGTSDAVFIKDAQGRYLLFNSAAGRFVGKPPEEVIGHDDTFIFQYDDAQSVMAGDRQVMAHGTTQTYEDLVTTPDGLRRTFMSTKGPLFGSDGAVIGLFGISRDITERKQAEEAVKDAELRYRSIFEQAPVGIATIDSLTGRFLSVNASFCAINGYANEEMLSRTFLDITHPDDLQADLDQMKRILDGDIAMFELDKHVLNKNGDTIWVHLTCVSLWQRPSDPRMHLAIVQDITERKRAEERAQQFQNELEQLVESRTADLQRTHRLLQSVIDSSPDWIYVKDREHRFVLVNKAFAASQQCAPADMADRLDTDFWPQELCEGNVAKGIRGFHTDDRRAFAGDMIRNPYDHASLHDGTLRIFDTYKGPWQDPSGQIGGVLCYARDVTEQRRAEESVRQLNSELAIRVDERTAELAQANRMLEADIAERKQAEEALHMSEEQFRAVVEAAPNGMVMTNEEGVITLVNQQIERQFGYQREELIGQPIDLLVPARYRTNHPDRRREYQAAPQARAMGAGRDLYGLQKNGKEFPVEVGLNPIETPQGWKVLASIVDITKRKELEAVRVRQYEALQAIFNMTVALSRASSLEEIYEQGINGVQGALKVDRASILLFDNDGVMKFKASRGLSKEYIQALEGHSPWSCEAVNPPPKSVADIEEDPYTEAYRGVFRAERILAMSIIPLWSSDGLLGTFMLYYDTPHQFTDEELQVSQTIAGHIAFMIHRKRVEEERSKQESLISLMLSTGPGCIKRVAADGALLHMNPAGLTMIEACREEEAIGLSVFDLVLPQHRTAFINMHQDVINGASRILQFEIQGLKGGCRWMETHAVPFRNPVTSSMEHLAVTHDITDRKQAEEALRISQEKLRQALQASNTGLWDWNTETNEASFSKEWKRQLGYEDAEIENVIESWETRLHPDDQASSVAYVRGYLAQPVGDYHQEFRLRHKDGTYRWIEARASFVTESDGRKVRLLGSHVDITERKQVAQALAEKTNELSDFIEHATVNMHWVGPDGIILWANKTELDFLGYTSEEYIGHYIAEFHVDQPAIQDILTRLTCAEIISEYPARLRCKDGSIKDVLIDSSVLWKDGKFSRTSCFTRDISLRKKAEAFAEGQRIVLDLIATNAPLAAILSRLCVEMEKQHDGMLCSVLLLEGVTLRHAAGPSLPDEYNRAIDGVRIGPSVGSCGTAAYRNDTVIVEDIAVDPLWADYKDLALRYGLKACWSMPIRDATGAVLGTFATYYRVPTIPSHVHVELIKMSAYLGGIAIERHSAEEALRSSEERFRLVAETTLDILWDRDCGTNKMWWSPNARVKFGGDPSGDVWEARLHPDDRDRILAQVRDALSSKAPKYSAEYRFRLEDGSYGYFLDRACILRDSLGKPTRMIGAMIDVTAAKQAYASLQEAYHRLQVMANKLQTVESDERRRLSRELHDEVGQLLTALKFDLESLRREKVGKKKMKQIQLAERLARALDTTDLLFTRLRQIVRSLRPPVLDSLGLKATLESLAADVKARTGLACSVLIEGADRLPGLTPTGETALYRIAQELLTNVMRHAQAKTVSLSLSVDSDHWLLTVEDDGIGFDLTALPETGGVGLRGIRERAEIFGGHLHLTSQQGHGTLAVVWLPAVVDRPPRPARQPAQTPSVRRSTRKRAHD